MDYFVSRRALQALVLAGLLALAGCTAYTGGGVDPTSTPAPTTSTLVPTTSTPATTTAPSSPATHESYFIFQNTWNASVTMADDFTYTVTLYVADAPVTAYTVTTADGQTRTYNRSIPRNVRINATAIAPAKVLHTETYEVKPQSTLYVGLENMTEEHALIYNYHSSQDIGVGFSQPPERSTGPWFMQIKSGESSVSVGGDYRQKVGENTTSHTITLDESRTTTG